MHQITYSSIQLKEIGTRCVGLIPTHRNSAYLKELGILSVRKWTHVRDEQRVVKEARNVCADDSLYTKNVFCSAKVPVLNNLSPMHKVGVHAPLNLCLVHKAKCNDSRELLLAFQNIEGFNQAKFVEFIDFFKNFDPSMLAIAEHWFMFDYDIPKIPNFKLWSKCRSNGKRGGVALYVDERKFGCSYVLPFPQSDVFKDIQQIWIQMPRSGLAVAVVYVPPGGDLAGRQEQLLAIAEFCEIAESHGLRPIIMGDLNIHDLEDVRVEHLDPNMRQEHTFINDMC